MKRAGNKCSPTGAVGIWLSGIGSVCEMAGLVFLKKIFVRLCGWEIHVSHTLYVVVGKQLCRGLYCI